VVEVGAPLPGKPLVKGQAKGYKMTSPRHFIVPKQNTKAQQTNPIEEIFSTGNRGTGRFSASEMQGLRRLVDNPKPPTKALCVAVSEELLSQK
jgi:hypothetical protein